MKNCEGERLLITILAQLVSLAVVRTANCSLTTTTTSPAATTTATETSSATADCYRDRGRDCECLYD